MNALAGLKRTCSGKGCHINSLVILWCVNHQYSVTSGVDIQYSNDT